MNMPAQMQETSITASSLILHGDSFARIIEIAEIMASGVATIPKHLQKNKGDCAAVTMQAMQWNMNPWSVAQKTHLINGVLGYEAQLVNAAINSMAPTKDRLNFEWFGDWEKIVGKFKEFESKTKKDDDGHPKKYRVPGWNIADEQGLGIKVWATLKAESKPRELTLLMTQARVRNSTLWADDPKQQIAYLAIKRWARLYCPDVILGVYSPDELEESNHDEREVNPPQGGQQAIQFYPDDAFEKNFAKWKSAVETGKSTNEQWIATLENKFPLTDLQKQRIYEVKPPIQGEVTEVSQ